MALNLKDIKELNKAINLLNLDNFDYDMVNHLKTAKNKYVAYNTIQYLIDLCHKIFADGKDVSDKNIEKYIAMICLYSNFLIKNYEEQMIEESVKNKAKILKNKYLEYANKINREVNDNILSRFSDLSSILKFEEEKEMSFDDLNKHVEEIYDLESKIKELNKTITAQTQEIQVLTKRNDSLEKIHTTDISAKLSLQEQINANNKKISELLSQIEELNNELLELKSECDKLKTSQSNFDEKTKEIKELNDMVAEQQKRISEYERKNSLMELESIKGKKIEELSSFVYTIISHNTRKTIDEILNECRKKGFSIDKSDIKLALESLSQTFKIKDDKYIVLPEKYKIVSPDIVKGASLNLDVGNRNYIDLLIISDLHCKLNDLKTCQAMDLVYNYCANEGIDLVLDLGDLLDIRENMTSKFDYENMLKFMLNTFPTDKSINHVVLGGNHDMNALRSGADLLKNICENKEGLIHLGYDHASLMFDNFKKNGISLLHKEYKVNSDLTNGIYGDDYYVNLIGHNHASKFDVMNQNIFVPSLTRDRVMDGAVRIRVYFDKNKDIDYMLCTLLQNDGQLRTVTEVPYQKVRTK